MKTYTETVYSRGVDVDVEIDVPNPTEFQASRVYTRQDGTQVKVMITNFCFGKRNHSKQKFAVAMFRKTDSKVLQDLGIMFEIQAEPRDIRTFEGKDARLDAISCAADMAVRSY